MKKQQLTYIFLALIFLSLGIFLTKKDRDNIIVGEKKTSSQESHLEDDGFEDQSKQFQPSLVKEEQESSDTDFLVKMRPNAKPLNLKKKEIEHRVATGLKNLNRASIVPSNQKMSDIESAFKHLKKTTPIPMNWFPTWGIDYGDYFVFSGNPTLKSSQAFLTSYLIHKKTGESWAYGGHPIGN